MNIALDDNTSNGTEEEGMSAKLYYTSFWDKFGMNINYFGMYPKT